MGALDDVCEIGRWERAGDSGVRSHVQPELTPRRGVFMRNRHDRCNPQRGDDNRRAA